MLIKLALGSTSAPTDEEKPSIEPTAIARRRRPHHRAFRQWLALNQERFAQSVQLQENPGEWLSFSFDGIHRAISGALTEDGLCIMATYQKEVWDWLFDDDAYPRRAPGGYVCAECLPGHQKLFVNREALWADHLFEALLKWVNETLACANWLVMEGSPGEYSYALLAESKPELRPATDAADRLVTLVLPLR
jgi:hypothetical protein